MARTWKRGGGSRTTNGIDSMKAQLTFLGTGTSQGVPIIGCTCAVCRSRDERDKRFRSSALVRYGGMTILVDAGPDFRSQMLRAGVGHLDAILLTHNHKDHTGGLDDVRSLNYIDRKAVEIYCEAPVLDTLRREYAYAFERVKYPGAPEWNVHLIDEKPFTVRSNEGYVLEWVHDVGYRYVPVEGPVPESKSVEIIPIRGWHGTMPVLGFRFGNIAYITDMSRLEDDQLDKLKAEFPNDYAERIDRVSEYCKQNGRSYKDYLATIRNWARRDAERKSNVIPLKNDVNAGYNQALSILGLKNG